jgi:hypothetical protein
LARSATNGAADAGNADVQIVISSIDWQLPAGCNEGAGVEALVIVSIRRGDEQSHPERED